MKCVLFLCCLYVLGAHCEKVSFIDPCHWKDSDCLLKSSKKAMKFLVHGDETLGVPSMDPLHINEVDASKGELKLLFKNMVVKRLSECILLKVVRSERLKISIEMECPFSATGQYRLNGKFFIAEINGEDDCEISTEKVRLSVDVTLTEFEKNGAVHYKFASFKFKLEPVDIFEFKFNNLKYGDDSEAKLVDEFVRKTWRDIVPDIGEPVIRKTVTLCVKGISKLFLAIAVHDLELA